MGFVIQWYVVGCSNGGVFSICATRDHVNLTRTIPAEPWRSGSGLQMVWVHPYRRKNKNQNKTEKIKQNKKQKQKQTKQNKKQKRKEKGKQYSFLFILGTSSATTWSTLKQAVLLQMCKYCSNLYIFSYNDNLNLAKLWRYRIAVSFTCTSSGSWWGKD